MQLTLIEPHAHFELIIALCPALTQLRYPLRIVCSTYCKKEVLRVYPKMEKQAQWDTSSNPKPPKPNSVLVFTSLQYERRRWLGWIRQFPSALIVHNANTYLGNPISQWATPPETYYPYPRYLFEKHLRFPIKNRVSRDILQHIQLIIPYSPLQTPFIQKHSSVPVYPLPFPTSKSSVPGEGYDFFPLYGKVNQLDTAFFQHILSELSPAQVCLCRADEKERIEKYLPKCHFIFSSVSHAQYMDLFRKARRVIVPLKLETSFGVVRELLGVTKVLTRMNSALMFNKPLLLPPAIPSPPPSPPVEELVEAFDALVSYFRSS